MTTVTAKPNYKKMVFTHWWNLSYLTAVGFAGLIGGPFLFFLGLVVDGFAVWMVPDIPGVQRALDNITRQKKIEDQRTYYANALWNMQPPASDNPFFKTGKTDWVDLARNRANDEIIKFGSLCRNVADLWEFRKGRPEAVSEDVLIRIEEMINGYMSLLFVIKTATQNINAIDQKKLAGEFEKLRASTQAADPNDKAFRIVLAERLRSIKAKVDSLPKLERRRNLASAQAENIIQNVEALAIQIKTQGAVELGAAVMDTGFLLDMDNSVDMMEVATEVRGLTAPSSMELDVENPALWDDLAAKLGTSGPTTPAPALPKPKKGKSIDYHTFGVDVREFEGRYEDGGKDE